MSLALIPVARLLHCLYVRISNTRLPTPVMIYTHHGMDFPVNTESQAYGYTECLHPTIYTQREYTHLSGVHLIIYIKGKIAARRYKINSRRRSLLHHRCT